MFKKIFMTFLCCLLLWNLISNATGGLTPYTLPEQTSNTQKPSNEVNNISGDKVVIKPHIKRHWPLMNDFRTEKEEISKQSLEVIQRVQQTKEQFKKNSNK